MSKKNKYNQEDISSFGSEDNSNGKIVEKILIVIVLYNTRLTDSLTFQTLKKSFQTFSSTVQADLMICDNSLVPQTDINSFDDYGEFNIYYLHDSANPGISLSYNRAVELASVKHKSWIIVFDQDTELPHNAIEKYVFSLKQWPNYSIYAPIVYSGNILLSPFRYIIYRGSPYKKIEAGAHSLRGKNVINSGLLIAIDAYIKAGGYDEKVWLYFSDVVFFDRLKKFYSTFIVLDLSLRHNIASLDYSSISFALNRFAYYCQGAKAASYSSGGIIDYIGYGVMVALRSLLMCMRFKNIAFFKVFYKSYIMSANEY